MIADSLLPLYDQADVSMNENDIIIKGVVSHWCGRFALYYNRFKHYLGANNKKLSDEAP
jgi:hypothetical protein